MAVATQKPRLAFKQMIIVFCQFGESFYIELSHFHIGSLHKFQHKVALRKAFWLANERFQKYGDVGVFSPHLIFLAVICFLPFIFFSLYRGLRVICKQDWLRQRREISYKKSLHCFFHMLFMRVPTFPKLFSCFLIFCFPPSFGLFFPSMNKDRPYSFTYRCLPLFNLFLTLPQKSN